MPIGGPTGIDFFYNSEGLPNSIVGAVVPVSDIDRSIKFYCDVLKMNIVNRSDNEVVVMFGDAFLVLRKSPTVGIDTGIFIGADDTFIFHRRMVDEGVVFIRHPELSNYGVYASFLDPDSNILHVTFLR